jgi:hypothetical protein
MRVAVIWKGKRMVSLLQQFSLETSPTDYLEVSIPCIFLWPTQHDAYLQAEATPQYGKLHSTIYAHAYTHISAVLRRYISVISVVWKRDHREVLIPSGPYKIGTLQGKYIATTHEKITAATSINKNLYNNFKVFYTRTLTS